MPIEMTQVTDSKNIAAFGYDEDTQVLDVQFVNSSDRYSFDMVPWAVAEGFREAASKGLYFRNNIKGRYRFFKS